MLRRPHRAAIGVALAAVGVGVLACRGERREPPERFVPAGASAAVILPEVGRAARELAQLHATVAGFPGAAELAGARDALAAQLGLDPLDPEALADAGFDPRGGAALAWLPGPGGAGGQGALLVLPVSSASRVEALLSRLARDRLGAVHRSSETHGRVTIAVLRTAPSAAPALAYAVVDRTALLASGPAAPAAVAGAAALAPQASLRESGGWASARRALGDDPALAQWVPAGSPLLEGLWAVRDGLAVGLSASSGRLVARAAVLLGAREPSFRALAADGRAAGAVAGLDPGAQLVARWDGDPAALGAKLVPLLPPAERARLAARGLDLERDLLPVLAPGAAVAVALAPALEVAGLSAATLRADPLRALEFEAVLPVKDAASAEAASARLSARSGAAPGAAPATPGGVHRIRTASGELAWRVDAGAGRIVAAGGRPGRLAALEERLATGAGWRAPSEAAGAALTGGLGGAVLHPERVARAVRALPQEAFGTGPSGFVMRSLVDRVVEPASRLAAVSLHAGLAEDALVLRLDVEVRAESAP